MYRSVLQKFQEIIVNADIVDFIAGMETMPDKMASMLKFPDTIHQPLKVFPGTETVLIRGAAVHQGKGMIYRANPMPNKIFFRFPEACLKIHKTGGAGLQDTLNVVGMDVNKARHDISPPGVKKESLFPVFPVKLRVIHGEDRTNPVFPDDNGMMGERFIGTNHSSVKNTFSHNYSYKSELTSVWV
jgi:hypothetical protein